MNLWVWIAVGLVAWVSAAGWYFFLRLGEKHRRPSRLRNFFEHVLMAPLMPIAYLVGYLTQRNRR